MTDTIVEQDALMSPNQGGKLEDLAAGCVCCLVVWNLLIHSLRWSKCWTKCVQALMNPNPLKDDERLDVLVVVVVDLLSKPKQPIDSWKQPIVCFGTITENCFVVWLSIKWFSNCLCSSF